MNKLSQKFVFLNLIPTVNCQNPIKNKNESVFFKLKSLKRCLPKGNERKEIIILF